MLRCVVRRVAQDVSKNLSAAIFRACFIPGSWRLDLGRPIDCLVEGSVRTLRNCFKTTGRNLNDVFKYTVDDFRRSSDESSPVAVRLDYIIYGSEMCRVQIVHRSRAWLCEAID